MSFGFGVAAGTVQKAVDDQPLDTSGLVAKRDTGFGNYRDLTYTKVNPFSLDANVRTQLPNDAGAVLETQLPSDIAHFYTPAGGRITGTANCDIIITVRAQVEPLDAYASYLQVEIDIGLDGSPIVIDMHKQSIAWGEDIYTNMSYVFSGYCAANFEQNGARIFVTSDGAINISNISLLVKRTHKAV